MSEIFPHEGLDLIIAIVPKNGTYVGTTYMGLFTTFTASTVGTGGQGRSGRSLFGITRFTLGNAVYDQSFIAETLAYGTFRRAGLLAPRTALANVSVNGEHFGLYVLREGYDKNFLRRHFADPDGNLYEGAVRVDIADAETIEFYTQAADLHTVSKNLQAAGVKPDSVELIMKPKNPVSLDPKDAITVMNCVDNLEELEDVQNVYSALELNDEVMKQLEAQAA